MSGSYFEDARVDLQGVARMIIDAVRLELLAQAGTATNKGDQRDSLCFHSSASSGGDTRNGTAERAVALIREHRERIAGSFTDLVFDAGYRTALDDVEHTLREKLK